MVYTSSSSVSRDENVSSIASVSRRRHNMSARRQRFSFHNASSRRHATREATRRVSHSQVVPSRVLAPARLVDVMDEPLERSHTMQRYPSLPAELRRPSFRPISPAAIAAVSPELEQVPIPFILREIHTQGKAMYATARHTVTKDSRTRLPREMDVVVNDVSAAPPTHAIAAYLQTSAMQKQRVSIHAVHGLVLAANCANLPPLPYSNPHAPEYPGFKASLPVIPLSIKCLETFPVLLEYLYTQNKDSLLRSILPISPLGDIPPPAKLSRELARMCAPVTLLSHLQRIHGLWGNVTALGVSDEGLWRIMVQAWEVLQDALA